MTGRRFPPPWTVERLPGGFKVIDANGQSLAYFYARENDHDANTAGVLTMDEARRLATNFAKLPTLLGKGDLRRQLRVVIHSTVHGGGKRRPVIVSKYNRKGAGEADALWSKVH